MAITLDGSTPAAVDNFGSTSLTAVTASFSPPAASLVLVGVVCQQGAGTIAVADSLSNSYAAGPAKNAFSANGVSLFQHYYATAPGAVTVTATRSVTTTGDFSVSAQVLDGAAASQAGAASATTSGSSTTPLTGSITPTALGGWVIAGVASNSTTGVASGLTDLHNVHDATDGCLATLGYAVTGALTAETVGWTNGGVNAFWSWAAWEILPAVTAAAPTASRFLAAPG